MSSKNEYVPSEHNGHSVFHKTPDPPPDIEEIRASMPKVGQRMRIAPHWMRTSVESPKEPIWCEVVYVNQSRLWYMVKYNGTGFREGFKAI